MRIVSLQEKTCPRCRETLPASAFNRNASSHDGLQSYCKPCAREKNAEVRARRRTGQLVVTLPTFHTCKRCKETKPQSEFSRRDTTRTGLHIYCRPCVSIKAREAKYGMDAATHQKLLIHQDGVCAICQLERPLVVDHCHDGGHVRALLCAPCNSALGLFGEDADRLLRARAYVRKFARREVATCA